MRTWGVVIATVLSAVSLSLAQEGTWEQKFPATSPQSGYYPAMAYDSAHNQVVLFGGVDSSVFSPSPNYSSDTWTWDGSTWSKQFPSTSPPPRCCYGMAYDAARGQIVIFGGANASGFLTDTWVWDGVDWTQKASGPGPRLHVAMAYDAARQQVVLFGGSNGTPSPYGDTWVWDGTTWTEKFPTHSPGLRDQFRLAYDASHAQVVLFGGWNGTDDVNETWVWDGIDWAQKSPVSSPPSPREDFAIAYDELLQHVVLFGGLHFPNCTLDDQTWTWDGTNWMQEIPATSPPGRGGAAAAYDGARGQVVVYGGKNCSQQVLTDTWVRAVSFTLQFPLKDTGGKFGDPYTWSVNSIFDHSMPLGAFCSDVNDTKGTTHVIAFTGEEGAGREKDGDGDPGEQPWKFRSANKGICGKGPRLQGYPKVGGGNFFVGPDGLRGTSDDPINYTGDSYLSYDGHPGYDYRADFEPVYAAASGTVVLASGCKVEIDHAAGYTTVYDHLSSISVPVGPVTVGQQIGVSGNCGTRDPHLHFGVKVRRSDGTKTEVDPYGWSGPGSDPYGIKNLRLWP